MGPVICFIDDSDFEHDLVRNVISPSAPDIDFIQAYTFDEARDLLRSKIPVLFLLDLWGRDMEVKRPYLMSKEELKKRFSSKTGEEFDFEAALNKQGSVIEGGESNRKTPFEVIEQMKENVRNEWLPFKKIHTQIQCAQF